MWRYLKAAFLARPRIPGLGDVPVNILIASAFVVAGLLHPAFWLLGLGVVGGLCFGLATSPRFRSTYDGNVSAGVSVRASVKKQDLIAALGKDGRERLGELQVRCSRVMGIYKANEADRIVVDASQQAFERLQWIYLKLLTAEQTMTQTATGQDERRVRSEIADIERELSTDKISASMRESREATLALLRKRLDSLEHREQALGEIRSNLNQIDTQVDLAIDEATLQGRPAAVSTNITLASQMLDARLFGGSMSVDLEPPQGLKN